MSQVTKKAYIYKSGSFSAMDLLTIDISFEVPKYELEEVAHIPGFSLGNSAIIVGQLPARVYRREEKLQAAPKIALYEFLVDIADTYLVMIPDLIAFFDFARSHFIQQIDAETTISTNDIERALWSIQEELQIIAAKVGESPEAKRKQK